MQIYELTSAPIVKEAGKLAAFADALQQHNAYQAGLGFLVDKEGPEVEIDHVTGEITIGGQKYDPTDPRHIKALRNYSMHNNLQQPNSQAPAPATAPTAAPTAAGPNAAASPMVQVGGQVLDPNNPADAKILAKLQAQQAPQQPAQQPQQAPQQPAPPTPEQIRKAKQHAAAAAAQRAMAESLSWSRSFDPSRTLLKKIKQP